MSDSIFSQILRKEIDSELTVYKDADTFAHISLHQKPQNLGHVLVIPKRQIKDIYELPQELDAPLMSSLRLISRAVKRAFDADGVHIRQNNEPAAGQDVFHLHFHVIPRFESDEFDSSSYSALPIEQRRRQAVILKQAIQEELNSP